MTAFDGPGPFDGDAAYNYINGLLDVPAELRIAIVGAFSDVAAGGVAARMPEAYRKMLGPSSAAYIDVDDGVWAWAAAEMLAIALGFPTETPVPEQVARAARAIKDPEDMAASAAVALKVVCNPGSSELASLLSGPGGIEALQRMERLSAALSSLE